MDPLAFPADFEGGFPTGAFACDPVLDYDLLFAPDLGLPFDVEEADEGFTGGGAHLWKGTSDLLYIDTLH